VVRNVQGEQTQLEAGVLMEGDWVDGRDGRGIKEKRGAPEGRGASRSLPCSIPVWSPLPTPPPHPPSLGLSARRPTLG
jgi:hypothetical protein